VIERYNQAFGFLWDANEDDHKKGWRPLEIVWKRQSLLFQTDQQRENQKDTLEKLSSASICTKTPL
jgi:hypothetical protein